MFRRCSALLAIRKTMAFWTTACVQHLRRKTPIPELESQQPHRRKDLPFFPCRGATLESEVRNPFAMSHDRRRGFFVPASFVRECPGACDWPRYQFNTPCGKPFVWRNLAIKLLE
jgi:hypothetical protein